MFRIVARLNKRSLLRVRGAVTPSAFKYWQPKMDNIRILYHPPLQLTTAAPTSTMARNVGSQTKLWNVPTPLSAQLMSTMANAALLLPFVSRCNNKNNTNTDSANNAHSVLLIALAAVVVSGDFGGQSSIVEAAKRKRVTAAKETSKKNQKRSRLHVVSFLGPPSASTPCQVVGLRGPKTGKNGPKRKNKSYWSKPKKMYCEFRKRAKSTKSEDSDYHLDDDGAAVYTTLKGKTQWIAPKKGTNKLDATVPAYLFFGQGNTPGVTQTEFDWFKYKIQKSNRKDLDQFKEELKNTKGARSKSYSYINIL